MAYSLVTYRLNGETLKTKISQTSEDGRDPVSDVEALSYLERKHGQRVALVSNVKFYPYE